MENPAMAGFWLSPQQKCVWSLQNNGRAYGSACMILFEGVASPDSLAAAIEHLVARHEILRTVYARQPKVIADSLSGTRAVSLASG